MPVNIFEETPDPSPALTDHVVGVKNPGVSWSVVNWTVASLRDLLKATPANVRAATVDKVLVADNLQTAAAPVAITFAAPLTLDWTAFINGTTTATANFTLNAPSNPIPGTWRRLEIVQDATGGRVMSFEAGAFRAAGGLGGIVLSTAAGARDVLHIYCATATMFELSLAADVKA